MDGISRSRGWDKKIPHCVLPMEQLVLSDKWARIPFLSRLYEFYLSIKDLEISNESNLFQNFHLCTQKSVYFF